MTIFVGCGFAAKYLHGGGNFSVPLQWMLGLLRLKQDPIWLEHLPGEGSRREDERKIDNFQRQMRAHGLAGRYCLLYHQNPERVHDLDALRCIGISKRELLNRLSGPNTILNLSYSIHPPLLLKFERRIFCDLDPSEIMFWMTKMELGQSSHHEFWTIGLNVNAADCRLPKTVMAGVSPASGESQRQSGSDPTLEKIEWKTFFPLVDTKLYQPKPRPKSTRFTTIGQWYWDGAVEVDGVYPDLSKKQAFEQYMDLPKRVPDAQFELAVHMNPGDPERQRIQDHGWRLADPHQLARTPQKYRQYLARALAEFTAIKGVDVSWRTGWLSDRAAAFLATGRPVITEDSGAAKYLPPGSGFHFVGDLEQSVAAIKDVLANWPRRSREARGCAVEVFDSAKNLKRNIGHLKPARFAIAKRLSGVTRSPVMADLMKAPELKERMKRIPEWELEKKHIERTFEFDDFADAIDFVNAVSEVAEEEEHHPDIDIRYNKVKLLLSTHSKGGLTELDFALAERIDTLSE